jgi:methionyl aminopeptidase
MIRLKGEHDIRGIWRSGQIAAALFAELEPHIQPGKTTQQLDSFAAEFIAHHGATAAFLGYRGYPASICTSLNDEVVHGIPGPRVLQRGDILSVDVGIALNGYICDTARSYWVGGPQPEAIQRLMAGTAQALTDGIAAAVVGQPLRLVSRAIQQSLQRHGLAVIQELTGHGVGFELHEEPTVYNFDPGARKPPLQNGMVLAIEPMASLGSRDVKLDDDQWTYRTADGSPAAHFEHTVALWDGRPFVLTDGGDEAARERFGSKVAGAG